MTAYFPARLHADRAATCFRLREFRVLCGRDRAALLSNAFFQISSHIASALEDGRSRKETTSSDRISVSTNP